jgi:hypothetical protein
MTTTLELLAVATDILLPGASLGHRLRRLAMTYGHAERNLAFIRQLEAEAQQLHCHYGPDGASLAAQPDGVWTWAAADQGGEYSREVQQQTRICTDLDARPGDCARRRWT